MKVKSNKMRNILLVAINLLLICIFAFIGKTYSYLTDQQSITFIASVSNINIVLKQDDRILTSEDNNIYLGTNLIEADHTYTLNVSLQNNENSQGYYIRFKAVAVVNGIIYNINEYITTPFYKNSDGWAYNTESSTSSTPLPLSSMQEKILIQDITIPNTAQSGELSISNMQGKNFQLYLYVQGSPSIDFDI